MAERSRFEAARRDLKDIFGAAVKAVEPASLVRSHLSPERGSISVADAVAISGKVLVVGAGKASAAMARGLEASCAGRLDLSGAVIAPSDGAAVDVGKQIVGVLRGAHPIPDSAGLMATRQIMDAVVSTPATHIICLVSGGASSLMVAPLAPIKLEEKQRITSALLKSGAPIEKVNTVRKHLSAIKGGKILRLAGGRPVTTLILSDVVGDDPSAVGSGPSVPDATTWSDARRVLEEYDLLGSSSDTIRELIRRGERGDIVETVRSDEAVSARWFVIGSNRVARSAAAARAKELGYDVEEDSEDLVGDSERVAKSWVAGALKMASDGPRSGRSRCLIGGGETTVQVVGGGRGGRNQHFALATVAALRGSNVGILSAGSDGIDGPTPAAGAFVDGDSAARAEKAGFDPQDHLERCDSYTFFKQLGDLHKTGPSGTNVMDLKIAVTATI